jgi:hypothetical protein
MSQHILPRVVCEVTTLFFSHVKRGGYSREYQKSALLFLQEVNMGKTSSAVKRRYNKANYKRYEFSIRLDRKLNYYLEDFKLKGGNVSELIKLTLAEHFNVHPEEDFFPFKPARRQAGTTGRPAN